MNELGSVTRRGFIGGAAASAVLAAAPAVFAQGSDKIRAEMSCCCVDLNDEFHNLFLQWCLVQSLLTIQVVFLDNEHLL